MARSTVLREIRSLDPESDHERIVFLSTCFDFPFDTTRALEFALFRTFCVPSISSLLDRTGEFGKRAQKRYDDTDIIVSEMLEWGYSSQRGARALERMNAIHGRFKIANSDFLHVLSTFVFEPIRWNARFGWRRMCDEERLGLFHFWRQVGRRMRIQDIPGTFEIFERFNIEYERENYRFSEANQRVGTATVDLFASWGPRFAAPVVRWAIYALLDEALLDAFGFPRPSPFARAVLPAAVKLRGRLAGLLPARRHPRLRTRMGHPTYPQRYEIETLGPEPAAPRRRRGTGA